MNKTTLMTVDQTRELAVREHADQRDQDGTLHIDHVARVACGVPTAAGYWRVAWLHDVLEDTSVTAADLRGRLPDTELDALVLLTHDDPDEAYVDYVTRIIDAPDAAGELARTVKQADMLDNLHRCARDKDVAVAQYAGAWLACGQWGSPGPSTPYRPTPRRSRSKACAWTSAAGCCWDATSVANGSCPGGAPLSVNRFLPAWCEKPQKRPS